MKIPHLHPATAAALLPLGGGVVLAGWGILAGSGPFGMKNQSHLGWTISLLGLGLGISALSGLLRGRRLLTYVSLMLLGMLVLSVCPRPVPQDATALPSHPGVYYGYPMRYGAEGHASYSFPYFKVISIKALLADLSFGGFLGFIVSTIACFLGPERSKTPTNASQVQAPPKAQPTPKQGS